MRFPFSFWKSSYIAPPPQPPQGDLVLWVEAGNLGPQPMAFWTDQTAFENDFNQPDVSKQPLCIDDDTGPNGLPFVRSDGIDDSLVTEDSPHLRLANDATLVLIFRTTAGDPFIFTHFVPSYPYGWALRFQNGNAGFENLNGWEYGGETINDGEWHVVVVRWSNGYATAMVDGLAQFTVPRLLDGSGPALIGDVACGAELFNLGNGLAPCAADIYGALAYEAAKTPEDVQAIFRFYRDKCATASRGDQLNHICFQGDSITYGTNSTAGHSYPDQLISFLGGTGVWAFENNGIVGATINTGFPSIARNAPTEWGAALNHGGGRDVTVIGGGSNDLATAGVSPATAFDNFKALFAEARKMFPTSRLIALTVLPRSGGGISPTFEADRQTFNASVRAETLGVYWDAVADVGNDPDIGQAGDEANPTYYSGDNVHPNDTGYGRIAQYVLTSI